MEHTKRMIWNWNRPISCVWAHANTFVPISPWVESFGTPEREEDNAWHGIKNTCRRSEQSIKKNVYIVNLILAYTYNIHKNRFCNHFCIAIMGLIVWQGPLSVRLGFCLWLCVTEEMAEMEPGAITLHLVYENFKPLAISRIILYVACSSPSRRRRKTSIKNLNIVFSHHGHCCYVAGVWLKNRNETHTRTGYGVRAWVIHYSSYMVQSWTNRIY